MSFLPARMSRLLVGGHKDHLEETIEALHQEGVVHIEDYRDPLGYTGIGTPLEAGDAASALLVRVRGLQKALGAEGMAAENGMAPPQVADEAEAATSAALERLRQLREAWARAEGDAAVLRPLSGLEVDLSSTQGLASVRVWLGTSRSDPSNAIAASGVVHEVQAVPSSGGYAILAVAPTGQSAPIERALAEAGFSPVAPSPGKGTPKERLAALAAEQQTLSHRLQAAESEVAALRSAWGSRLAGAEHALSLEVERTQAPLRFGVTQTTFHLEGWVPAGEVDRVEEALVARFGDKLYFHHLGDGTHGHGDHGAHGHGDHAHGDHGHDHGHDHGDHGHGTHGHAPAEADDHHNVDPKDEPPIHLLNPTAARPYEWILGLLARPRYQEIDPSKLMLFFFPLFFGFMVGDVAVGVLVALFGWWLIGHKLIGIGGPAVGKAIVAGGIVSIFVGLFVFGEALGIHFVTENPEEMSWEAILGLDIPYADEPHGFLYKTGSAAVAAAGALSPLAAGAEEAHGLLSPHSSVHLTAGGIVNLGYYSKLHDVMPLLAWSLIIALVHINLGLILGFRNVKAAHGLGLAIQEKGGWITLQLGGAVAFWGSTMSGPDGITQAGWAVVGAGLGLVVASLVFLWIGATKVMGMGIVSLLEIPSLLGNAVSYTRLAAIGASKAGLGLALGVICFETLGGGALGWILYMVGFLGITALAVLTGSLQSLRLQFVEFFGKFFTGGGRPYVPFGRRAA